MVPMLDVDFLIGDIYVLIRECYVLVLKDLITFHIIEKEMKMLVEKLSIISELISLECLLHLLDTYTYEYVKG